MGQKESYTTSAQLDALVLQMYRAGIGFAEAVREFRKQFVLTALRDANWNESKAAPVLRMHRNTLRPHSPGIEFRYPPSPPV
jgi:Fis family transcriptional regulator, factor for inversion stimulation protein